MTNVSPACLSAETGGANDCVPGEETSLIQTEIASERWSEEFELRIKIWLASYKEPRKPCSKLSVFFHFPQKKPSSS